MVVERMLPRLLRLEGIVIVDLNRVLRELLFYWYQSVSARSMNSRWAAQVKLPVTGAPVTVLRTHTHSTDCQH